MLPKKRRSSPHDPKIVLIDDTFFMLLANKLDECPYASIYECSRKGILRPPCPLFSRCIRFWDRHICYSTNGQSAHAMAESRYKDLFRGLELLLNARGELAGSSSMPPGQYDTEQRTQLKSRLA